jgi:hypothetical protein
LLTRIGPGHDRRYQRYRSETMSLIPALSIQTESDRNKWPWRGHFVRRLFVPIGSSTSGGHSWESCAPPCQLPSGFPFFFAFAPRSSSVS